MGSALALLPCCCLEGPESCTCGGNNSMAESELLRTEYVTIICWPLSVHRPMATCNCLPSQFGVATRICLSSSFCAAPVAPFAGEAIGGGSEPAALVSPTVNLDSVT